MSKETDLLQIPPLVFEGRSYPFPAVTGDIEINFEQWHEQYAWDKIERSKRARPSSYELNMTIWQRMVSANEFEWTGELSNKMRWSEAGQKELLWHILASATPTITRKLVDKIFKDPAAQRTLFEFSKEGAVGLYWRSVAMARPTLPPAPTTDTAAENEILS
jgi:hypothetical protein